MFISLPLALPQEPCWMAFVSRSWHSVTRSHHWTSKNSEHESCPWWGELFLKERAYLSRAQALTKWRGQAPYNFPLQYFSQTTLKHLYCSVLVTLEGELALLYPSICFSHCDESMFNFPVSVRNKRLPLLEISIYTWTALHHSPLKTTYAVPSLRTRKKRNMLHTKKKLSAGLRAWSEELIHQRFTVTACPALTNLSSVRKPHVPKKVAVFLTGIYTTSMLKEQPIFFHTSTFCSSLYSSVSKEHKHCGTFKSLCRVSVVCL